MRGMQNRKMLLLVALASTMMILPITLPSAHATGISNGAPGADVCGDAPENSTSNVLILDVPDSSGSEGIPAATSKVPAPDAVRVSSDLLSRITDEDVLILESKLYNGIPLIVYGEAASLKVFKGLSVSISKNADAVAVHCDPLTKITCCYSIESADSDRLLRDWVKGLPRSTEAAPQNRNWGDVLVSQGTKDCGDGTRMNVTTLYEKVGEGNGKKFYSVKYGLESVPGGKKTADLTVGCNVRNHNSLQSLLSHGPNTTAGISTTNVSLSVSVGTSGISGGINVGWSYATSDVRVMNQSNTWENLFKVWHDVNEFAAVGQYTYTVNPGMIVSVQNGSSYYGEDEYSAKYCKRYSKFWPWDPEYTWHDYSLSLMVLISS